MTRVAAVTLPHQFAQVREHADHMLAQAAGACRFAWRALRHIVRNHRYLTFVKLANYALLLAQHRMKTERVIGMPAKMKIEATNICNTKCQLCPTGQGLHGRPAKVLDFAMYSQLVERHAWHLLSLDLSMWGDPLIVPDIYRMIRFAHERRIWTYLSSNLHAFRPDQTRKGESRTQAETLVESGLDMLTCSLHGATQATYEAYQPGKRLDDALAKIQRIVETRDRLKSLTPQLQLNFAVTRKNEHEIEAFNRLAARLGATPVFSPAMMNTRFLGCDQKLQPLGLAPDLVEKRTQARLDEWLPSDPQWRMPGYESMLSASGSGGTSGGASYNGHKIFACDWPWVQAVINCDGKVSVCCGSFGEQEDMGDVTAQSLGKIWNSEKYRMARRSFSRPVDDEHRSGNPCADCPGCML